MPSHYHLPLPSICPSPVLSIPIPYERIQDLTYTHGCPAWNNAQIDFVLFTELFGCSVNAIVGTYRKACFFKNVDCHFSSSLPDWRWQCRWLFLIPLLCGCCIPPFLSAQVGLIERARTVGPTDLPCKRCSRRTHAAAADTLLHIGSGLTAA